MAKVIEGVRKFILKNKDIIRDQEWNQLFNNWLGESWHTLFIDDTVQMNNLFDVLEEAGYVDIIEDSRDARKSLLINQLLDAYEKYCSRHYSLGDELQVEYSDLVSCINSYMGFDIYGIYNVIEEGQFEKLLKDTYDAKLDKSNKRIIIK